MAWQYRAAFDRMLSGKTQKAYTGGFRRKKDGKIDRRFKSSRRFIALAAMAGVTVGCAPSLVSGNSAGGVISLGGVVGEQRKGMATAEAECAKYGKIAVSKGVNVLSDTMRYECVKPE